MRKGRCGGFFIPIPEKRETACCLVRCCGRLRSFLATGCLQAVADADGLLPPPRPSPTGEGAVLRQIQITAAISHMDSYETIAIFAANASPPPVGEGQGGGSRQQLGRFGILSGCRASYGLEGSLLIAALSHRERADRWLASPCYNKNHKPNMEY